MSNAINTTEIQGIGLANLRNDGNYQFHVDVRNIIIEFDPRRLNITLLFEVYVAAILREDEALKIIIKSEYTEQIHDADRARDRAYTSITTTVNMLLKHHNPEIVLIAKRLKILLTAYGKINKKSYKEQTSAVYNILQEFRGHYAEDIETIRIPELVDELERANVEFERLMELRDAEAVGRNHDTMKEARKASDDAYHAIRKRINAFVETEGPENYAGFIMKLNHVIDRYKLLLTKAHKKKKEEPTAAKKPEQKSKAKKQEPKEKAKKPEPKKQEPKAKAAAKPKEKENKAV